MKALFKGTIQLALLSIAAKVYKATNDEGGVKFRKLHNKCLTPINQIRICRKCGEQEIEWNDLVDGYDAGGEFIVFTEEEIKSLSEDGGKTIKIKECVPANKIQDVMMDAFYYVAPDKGFERIYNLLLEAMRSTNLCLVGSWFFRGKEYNVCISAHEGVLLMATLRYVDEVNKISEIPSIESLKKEIPTGDEIGLGIELLKKYTKEEFKIPDSSSFMIKFQTLMNQKTLGGIAPVQVVETQTVNKAKSIMDDLKASLQIA